MAWISPVDQGVDGIARAAVAVDQHQIGPAVPVQVGALQAHGTEPLQLAAVGRVEAQGTVPVNVGGHVVASGVAFVGKGDVGPAVTIEVGRDDVAGVQGRQVGPPSAFEPLRASPVDGGRLLAPVGQDQVGKAVPVQLGDLASNGSRGRQLRPWLRGEAFGTAFEELGPVVAVSHHQVQGAVPVQVGQAQSGRVPALHPVPPLDGKARGAAPVEINALLLGVVVHEQQLGEAISVEVSGGHVQGADRGHHRPPPAAEAGGAVPVDIGFQVLGRPEALPALDAVVGDGQVYKSVPIEIRRRHRAAQQGGQQRPPVGLEPLPGSPVDHEIGLDPVVVNEVAEDQVQVAVLIEVLEQGTPAPLAGKPGHTGLALADLSQQLAQGLLVGQVGKQGAKPLRASPVDKHVLALDLVVVLSHEQVQETVVVQVPAVNHLDGSGSADVEIGSSVGQRPPREVLEAGMTNPGLVGDRTGGGRQQQPRPQAPGDEGGLGHGWDGAGGGPLNCRGP